MHIGRDLIAMPSHLCAAGEYAKAADFITKFAQHRLLIFNSRFRV